MEIKDLQTDHTYLLRYRMTSTVSSVTILMITDMAYHCRWNNGLTSNDTWELKEHLEKTYNVVEDITSQLAVKNSEVVTINPITLVSTKLIKCHICHGMGTVPNTKSTAGTITCPACNGAKMIPDIITLTQQE